MYLVLLVSVGLCVTAFLQFILSVTRVRVPLGIAAALSGLPLLVGAIGTWFGISLALTAIDFSNPQMRSALSTQGLIIALYPTIAGALFTSLLTTLYALVVGLAATLAPGEDARFTPIHGTLGVLYVGAGLISFVLGSFLLSLTLVGLGFAVFFANLRTPRNPDSIDSSRLAGVRVGVNALALLAIASGGLFELLFTYTGFTLAAIRVSSELRMAMQAHGIVSLWWSLAFAGALGLGVISLAVSIGMNHKQLNGKRAALSAGLFGVSLLPLIGILLVLTPNALLLHEQSTPYEQIRSPLIAAAGLTLPTYQGKNTIRLFEQPVLQIGPSGMTYNDQPIHDLSQLTPGESINLEADASTRLSDLAPLVPAIGKIPVYWTVDAVGPHLVETTLSSGPLPPGEDGFVPAGDQFVLIQRKGDKLVEIKRDDQLKTPLIHDATYHVWLPEKTLQEVISTIEPLITGRDSVVQHPEAPPAFTAASKTTDSPPELSLEGKGSLDPSQVVGTIEKSARMLQYCYERVLTKQPDLAGEFSVQFVITDSGSVRDPMIESTTLHNDEVEKCVIGRFKRMSFPAPEGGEVRVKFPIVFAPS